MGMNRFSRAALLIISLAIIVLVTFWALCQQSKRPTPYPTKSVVDGQELLLLEPEAVDGREAGGTPLGWSPHIFPSISSRTTYSIVREGPSGLAVAAVADSSASGLRKDVLIEAGELPIARWTWRVERALDQADLSVKGGDDCAARLILMYRDPEHEPSLSERAYAIAYRRLNGTSPPTHMLIYAWTGDSAKKSFYINRCEGAQGERHRALSRQALELAGVSEGPLGQVFATDFFTTEVGTRRTSHRLHPLRDRPQEQEGARRWSYSEPRRILDGPCGEEPHRLLRRFPARQARVHLRPGHQVQRAVPGAP